MSRPRFLADHDLKEVIIAGVLHREPAVEFIRLREVGLATRPDLDVLRFAAANHFIVVSHDVNSMTAAAYAMLAATEPMHGLLVAHQNDPVRPIIEDLIAMWHATEAAEWINQVQYLPI